MISETAVMRPGLAVVIQLVIASIVQAYNDGDVQLIGADGNPTFEGGLQVYKQGNWNSVCYEDSNDFDFNDIAATATAVCRQLGYRDIKYIGNDFINLASYTVITSIRCPSVMTSTEAEILNILRCDVGKVVSPGEANCGLLDIGCDKTEYFYNGQVRIPHNNHYDSSFALLEINLREDWRPICISTADGMNSFVADSACRQMGYTNAKSHNPSENFRKKSWKIDILSSCLMRTGSSPCFTDCINHYTAVDNCADDDENVYELICFFDEVNKVVFSSGTETLCRYSSSASNGTTTAPAVIDIRIFYSVTGVLSLFSMILLVIVIVQCSCRRRKAAEDDNNPAQPNIMFRWLRGRRADYGAVAERDN